MSARTRAKTLLGDALGRGDRFLGSRSELTVFNSHRTPTNRANDFSDVIAAISARYRWLAPESLGDYVQNPAQFQDGPYALWTFDDGFRDNIASAQVLADRGISAIYFIATGFLQSDDPWAFYLNSIQRGRNPSPEEQSKPEAFLPMEVAELQRIAELGHVVGSHTVNHRLLEALDDRERDRELGQSRDDLAAWLGERPRVFASPFDTRRADRQTMAAVAKHYEHHFTTLDLSNRRHGGTALYRTNVEIDWDRRRIGYAVSVRTPERLRWGLQNRKFPALVSTAHEEV